MEGERGGGGKRRKGWLALVGIAVECGATPARGGRGRGRRGTLGVLIQKFDDTGVAAIQGIIHWGLSITVLHQGVGPMLQQALHCKLLATRGSQVKWGLAIFVGNVRVASFVQEVCQHRVRLLSHYPVQQRVSLVILNVQKGSILKQGCEHRLVSTD